MPLYEYACAGCGHRFEVLQRMGEGNEGLACPSCAAKRPARQLSTFAAATADGAGAAAAACAAPGCGSGFT